MRQQVTVQPGGVVEVRSPDLIPGARAEVIILLEHAGADQSSTTGGSPGNHEPTDGWERLRRHAGAVNSADRRGSDNERIDEDLAREYGSDHEPTA